MMKIIGHIKVELIEKQLPLILFAAIEIDY